MTISQHFSQYQSKWCLRNFDFFQDVLSVILGDKGFWESLLKYEAEGTGTCSLQLCIILLTVGELAILNRRWEYSTGISQENWLNKLPTCKCLK